MYLGLKRKCSFSYFRENFAKIYFRFSRKFPYENYENYKNFREDFRENTKNWIFSLTLGL